MRLVSRFVCFCLMMLVLITSTPLFANENRTKQDLNEVQSELKKRSAKYEAQKKAISELNDALKSIERDVAKNAKALNNLKRSIRENKSKITALNQEQNALNTQAKKLREVLAKQLKSAYMTGSHDYAKLLFNQEQAATFERALSYYKYLNDARIAQLEELKQILAQLSQTQIALEQSQQTQMVLVADQEQKQRALLLTKQEQKSKVAALNRELNTLENSIVYLKQNEQTLLHTLKQLEQSVDTQVDLLGLNKVKSSLRWPTKGRLKHKFGNRKHGSFRWKGVLIGASEGAEVSALADGQVVYADWLKGFGWVLVLDHGEGFMSLYGHAQTLLYDVGDMINQGETIALVGQSGGQSQPGLYFEIRHKGRAVNPSYWCR